MVAPLLILISRLVWLLPSWIEACCGFSFEIRFNNRSQFVNRNVLHFFVISKIFHLFKLCILTFLPKLFMDWKNWNFYTIFTIRNLLLWNENGVNILHSSWGCSNISCKPFCNRDQGTHFQLQKHADARNFFS